MCLARLDCCCSSAPSQVPASPCGWLAASSRLSRFFQPARVCGTAGSSSMGAIRVSHERCRSATVDSRSTSSAPASLRRNRRYTERAARTMARLASVQRCADRQDSSSGQRITRSNRQRVAAWSAMSRPHAARAAATVAASLRRTICSASANVTPLDSRRRKRSARTADAASTLTSRAALRGGSSRAAGPAASTTTPMPGSSQAANTARSVSRAAVVLPLPSADAGSVFLAGEPAGTRVRRLPVSRSLASVVLPAAVGPVMNTTGAAAVGFGGLRLACALSPW